ncbi:hypothetical protein D3C83_214600 [compost metagenome]
MTGLAPVAGQVELLDQFNELRLGARGLQIGRPGKRKSPGAIFAGRLCEAVGKRLFLTGRGDQ